jgi:hypothetical protein
MLEGGEKLDGAIAGCLGGATREQFLAVTGTFVAEHYASMR